MGSNSSKAEFVDSIPEEEKFVDVFCQKQDHNENKMRAFELNEQKVLLTKENGQISSVRNKSSCYDAPLVIGDTKGFPILENEPATFEEAITATKFGKFNVILALLTLLASLCAAFDTSSMSYTFVAAQCDLDLTLRDKGFLNSITYTGMVTSAVIWGFLFDVLGRKKLLTIGFLIDAVFVFMSAFSQNITLLLISKFLQGFTINGPFAALSSYMSEFHCAKYRPTFQLLIGLCISNGTLVLPLIAWIILPRNMDFTLLNLNFHSWNVFLLVSGLPAFFSGMIFIFFPESPKFLMTCGENEKALAVFRKVYSINTGQPEDTFPIKSLIEETKLTKNSKHGGQITANRTKAQALREGFQQIKPLFFSPHLARIVLTCSIIFFVLMSLQMLRLWLPQIFQIMTDYVQAHNGTSASLCVMLETISSPNKTTEVCTVNTDNATVYINSAIVGFASACACGIVGFIIRFIGKKKILLTLEILSIVCCISMYYAKNPSIALACSSLFVASTTVCSSIMTSITVDLFPTILRTLTISLGMMVGRIGAMFGNFIFPFLLASGCEPPFFVVAGFMLVSEHEPATFEEAVTATKFGKFNIILALLAMVASLCTVFDTSTMSYAFVVAQCDLNLSLGDKGILNSVTYIGMVSSAVIWGFLFDVLGRKKLLSIGFLVDAIFVFMSSLSQNMTLLIISKFLQGFIINGPFAALSSYMCEFHCAEYRPAFQLLIGSCMNIGNIILALIAWVILPQNLDFSLVNLDFHSWNVFLAICGLPAFLSGLIFLFFPESPKFLMTCGENEKALAVFKKVYRINTGLPEDTFPIKRLVEETKQNASNKHGGQITAQRTNIQALKEGFRQIRPLFFKPHLSKVILSSGIIFFVHMSMNMLRLWLPQIFQIMTDYQLAHNGSSASLCVMLETVSSSNKNAGECVVNTDNSTIYINSAIVGFTATCACSFVGLIVRFTEKKKIFISSAIIGSVCCGSLIFARSPSIALACSSLFIASGAVCNNVMTSIAVDLFPTSLRTLALATGLMLGRLGGMTGNFMFPYLLESGCQPPFLVVASFLLAAFLLSLFLPKTDGQALV